MREDRFQTEAGFESLKSKSMYGADRLQANSAPGGTFTDCLSRRIPWLSSAIAARFQNDDLSYVDLDARANRMAHFLKNLGVGPEVLVGVCAKRSLEFAVTLLAVWKAGGAYLPLDPDYPAQRLNCLLADAKPAVVLTQTALRARFIGCPVPTVAIEELQDLPHLPRESPRASASSENLAYVIYTSGSTGAPKGVEISHRALLNHSLVISQIYQLCPADRVLQFASLSFDVSIEEMIPSWLSGCTVVLRPSDAISSVQEFLRFVAQERLSVLNLPTAYWHELVANFSDNLWPRSVRLVIIGGEKVSEQAYRRWKQMVPASVRLLNAYGPTEATITALVCEADRTRDTLPIGKPITNTYAIILDQNLRPVADGAQGELYLGGVNLARGYLRRPELTAERFIPNPGCIPSERLYRTGDLAKLEPDGNFEFVGRVDGQVKIRGFRIEPGEIESALRSCPSVKEAVVIAQNDRAEHKRLVAYFVAQPRYSPSVSDLMEFLRGRLPAYMVPSAFIPLDALPITPSGKLDRQALAPPDEARPALARQCDNPITGIQADLAAIWGEVLQIQEVGIHDNFLELGGDSLLAMQVLARVRERFGFELTLSRLFEKPTVADLATVLDGISPDPNASGSSAQRQRLSRGDNNPPASFIQQQLFFLHELSPTSDAYNMACAFHLDGDVDPQRMECALNNVVARHETLRTRFEYVGGNLCQCIVPNLHVQITLSSLAHVPRRTREIELQRHLAVEIGRAFNLGNTPLLRVLLFRFGEREHALLTVMHHIVSDGWSLGILFREWSQAYAAMTSGSPTTCSRLAVQYSDFADWQRDEIKGASLEKHMCFWKRVLAGAPRAITWPAIAPERAAVHASKAAGRSAITLPDQSISVGTKVLRARGVTPFMALLGALAVTLYKWTRVADLVIGTVVAGRSRREFEALIGCFMNFLPLRIRLSASQSAAEMLAEIRQTVLAAQTHQDCPFEHIVAAANPKRTLSRNPLFNVALLWHNYPAATFAAPGVKIKPIPLPARRPLLDLRFEAEAHGSEWSMMCEYDQALFNERTICQTLNMFQRAFELLVHQPQIALEDFNVEQPAQSPRGFLSWPRRLFGRASTGEVSRLGDNATNAASAGYKTHG
ncbi:MAG TPA: amino acid adenylation domain-containing protein [Verrucomicrobiae bacterium]|nr:amino acid adenylation domain-containing protein [Verrucomicrobiae bacterium]